MSEKKINKHHRKANFHSLNLSENSNSIETAEVDAFNNKQSNFLKRMSGSQKLWTFGLIALLSLGVFGAGMKYLEDSAKQQKAVKANGSGKQTDDGLLSSVNPFLEPTTPTPTPQLSKEYLYAGSRMLAVEDANANAAPPTDLAVWRPSSGYWCVMGGIPGSQQTFAQWGLSDDLPVQGDYDGDGKTDFSVFRPSTGYWYVSNSSNGNMFSFQFGASGDKPAPADYDGDGKTDIAVYRQSNGTWYLMKSSAGYAEQQFGLGSDKPVPADYDGDGKADFAVWRNSAASFYILRSSDAAFQTIQFGHLGDTPVVGDFDGDGKADAGVWRPVGASNNEAYQWQIRYSSNNTYYATSMGDPATDIAVQNDYDGDGKVDVAIWRPSNGYWYIQQSSLGGQARNVQWGQNGDVPVPAFYRR